MRIEIVSDTICPWCFVGKRRFELALNLRPQPGLFLTWRPYQLNPTMPREGVDRKSYLVSKFGDLEHAERVNSKLRKVGKEVGIKFQFDDIRVTPNTVNSHRLIQFAKTNDAKEIDVVEELYKAYFQKSENIGDPNVLLNIAVKAGLDAQEFKNYLLSDNDRAYILEQDTAIRRDGITSAPCFIIEGKYVVSGAQSPEIFHQIFDLVKQDKNS
jgi:predicted DsbA family dithiol-disulfide isomerase